MPSTTYLAQEDGPGRALMVLLPGRHDSAADFDKHGFVQMARKARAPVDLVAADAQYGYYVSRTLGDRLAEDVFAPARARGYQSFWMAGISMGAFGALIYAEQHPGEVEGLLAIAPFLGDDDLIKEIEDAGGLAKWKTTAKPAPGDYLRQLWLWLGRCTPQAQGCPRIFLGFGQSDRFIRAERLLAAELPADQVVQVPGDHDWGPWEQVFSMSLPHMFPQKI
jgi:S-formylglutathione hydrolase FrmB